MEDKKAKFIVFIVIATIAFICSTAVYSTTGGLSDWLVSSMNQNEDANNNGYLDSSEPSNGGFFENLFSNDDDSSGNGGYYSSSSDSSGDEPDLLARILRGIIGGSSIESSNSYSDNSYYDDGSSSDFSESFNSLIDKGTNKLDQMFNS